MEENNTDNVIDEKLFLQACKEFVKERKMTEYSTDLNYEEDCKIDSENLHKEWARQSSLAYDYKKHFRNLEKICKKKHEAVKTIRSELIDEANRNPEKCCKKSKPNASDIEAFYRNNEEYKEAKEEWIEAEYELGMAEDAKDEIAFTRKKSLEELGKLWFAEYYSIPDLPKNFGKDTVSITRKKKKGKTNG